MTKMSSSSTIGRCLFSRLIRPLFWLTSCVTEQLASVHSLIVQINLHTQPHGHFDFRGRQEWSIPTLCFLNVFVPYIGTEVVEHTNAQSNLD